MKYSELQNDVTVSLGDFYRLHKKELEEVLHYYELSRDGLYEDISEEELRYHLDQSDTLVLTANNIETGILHFMIVKQNGGRQIKRISYDSVTYHFFQWHNQMVVHVWAKSIGSHTQQGSSKMIRKVCTGQFAPKYIFSLGVAFGLDHKKYQVGDVLVSSQIFSYDKGVKVTKGSIMIKEEHSFRTDIWLLERIRQQRWLFEATQRTSLSEYKVGIGDFLTGEFVVDDAKFRKLIQQAFDHISFIGGEMEGYGVYDEAQELECPAIIIKGICDWGVNKNALFDIVAKNNPMANEEQKQAINKDLKDAMQAYAMMNTFDVCNNLFMRDVFSGNPKNRRKLYYQEASEITIPDSSKKKLYNK